MGGTLCEAHGTGRLGQKEDTMAEDFPRTVDAITPAWLSTVLGRTVTSYHTTFLEGGVLSDAFKLSALTYDGERGDAPSSVVIKLANRAPDLRGFAHMSHAYQKECLFFQQLAHEVPIQVPTVYGCWADGSANAEYFVLVLEDLTTHSKVFDQVTDPPDEACARQLALEAAKLHAHYWESATTRLPWVGRADHRYVFALDALSQLAPNAWAPFRALWAQMYGQDIFADATLQPVEALTEILCGPTSRAIHAQIYAILSTRPHTLLHGDMRGDNVFRTYPTVGPQDTPPVLTFIDWQLLHAGPPGPEFTQAWQYSLEPEVRRKDREMLQQYHTRLVALNPAAAAYTYDMLVEDYTLSFCFWWTAVISIGVGTLPSFDTPEGARMKQLWGKSIPRALCAMRDLDCLSRITPLAADVPAVPPEEAATAALPGTA
jgi:aminoglycoside phosphotransferase (APT) family kinase protein